MSYDKYCICSHILSLFASFPLLHDAKIFDCDSSCTSLPAFLIIIVMVLPLKSEQFRHPKSDIIIPNFDDRRNGKQCSRDKMFDLSLIWIYAVCTDQSVRKFMIIAHYAFLNFFAKRLTLNGSPKAYSLTCMKYFSISGNISCHIFTNVQW